MGNIKKIETNTLVLLTWLTDGHCKGPRRRGFRAKQIRREGLGIH